MQVGFIGLGNVGSKLARSLLRNGVDLAVLDLSEAAIEPLVEAGARRGADPRSMTESCEVVITCLPNPTASRQVLEGDAGILEGMSAGKIWAEMSTTDQSEVVRLGSLVDERGGSAIDCPVSGGCHRAASGNIAILAGGTRETFERMLPLLTAMGRQVLHTGPLGSASILKVLTNFLASANLVAVTEALVTAQCLGMDLNTTYEAIKVSSGNSFVHETESQVILNGSRNISFTMDLVVKDLTLFQALADQAQVPLELSPLLVEIFKDGQLRYGPREWSDNIIRRLEEAVGTQVLAPGFPSELEDDEPEVPGYEIVVPRG